MSNNSNNPNTNYNILPPDYDIHVPNQLLAKDRTIYDPCYLHTYVSTNKAYSDYKITNYRQHYNNCKKDFNNFNDIYYRIGISDGYTGACNIDTDSNITRGKFYSMPLEKLNDKITSERHMIYLPNNYKDIYHNDFLTSTTHSHNPQELFDPSFNIYGVSTSHYKRKQDSFYKNYHNNKKSFFSSNYGRQYK